ncbi:hypothetical protein [Roseimaritima ulvae]|uniref:Uncharacterized protein n=1 Tax=Roseimaritima ulvae TaxID=980254 RepID=A0A5B9QR75_9BACT|nr:hypothetical protein [Roseimaritima ulvae]QEG41528.1 hypothetical protein UC8_35520 [Roseimaritima ulvae]
MIYKHLTALLCFTFLPLAVGCGGPAADAPDDSQTTITMDGPPPEFDDVHDHPSEGPHHGTLVELGSEEYHAEVVHDEQSVTIYILDASATEPVAIDAADLTINLTHDGSPEQFKLVADPDEGDGEGKSSRFTLADAELVKHLDDDAAAPTLTVTIAGTPYRGQIKHDHDHDGHDHAGHQH